MNIKLKRLGFFSSQTEQETDSFLRSHCGGTPDSIDDMVVHYLTTATRVFAVPGIVIDYLSPKREVIGSPDVYTDGEWAWTSDISYYVRNYHLRLPANFITRMKSYNWPPHQIDNLEHLDFGLSSD